jgi:hypothetical protein
VRSLTRHRPRPWGWFAAWLLVGGAWSFALLALASVGLFVLPVAVAATVLIAKWSHKLGVIGLLSGLGLPVLYVAYLNRRGPGNVCTSHAANQSCVQESSPWPWLAAALLLVCLGLTLFAVRHRSE